MTKEDKIKAFTMRLDGVSYQKIADEFGVSKQRIEQILKGNPGTKRESNASKCIFTGLSDWIIQENMTLKKLSELMEWSKTSQMTAAKKITGKRELKMSEIRKILEMTGMTFEECFSLKAETPGAATPRESEKLS